MVAVQKFVDVANTANRVVIEANQDRNGGAIKGSNRLKDWTVSFLSNVPILKDSNFVLSYVEKIESENKDAINAFISALGVKYGTAGKKAAFNSLDGKYPPLNKRRVEALIGVATEASAQKATSSERLLSLAKRALDRVKGKAEPSQVQPPETRKNTSSGGFLESTIQLKEHLKAKSEAKESLYKSKKIKGSKSKKSQFPLNFLFKKIKKSADNFSQDFRSDTKTVVKGLKRTRKEFEKGVRNEFSDQIYDIRKGAKKLEKGVNRLVGDEAREVKVIVKDKGNKFFDYLKAVINK